MHYIINKTVSFGSLKSGQMHTNVCVVKVVNPVTFIRLLLQFREQFTLHVHIVTHNKAFPKTNGYDGVINITVSAKTYEPGGKLTVLQKYSLN